MPVPLPQHGNVRGPSTGASRGNAKAGLAAAEVMVEGEYRTQVQTHCCMEPHAVVADWRKDGLTVYMSTQYTAGIRAQLAQAFGLPLGRVRVVVEAMGGGFGSKSGVNNYVLAAVALSRQANAPVRLVLDRHEEQIDSGNRPATVQHIQSRRAPRRHADGGVDRHLRHRRRGDRRRRRQFRAGDLHLRQFRHGAVRRVHQCRARLRHARARQRARRLRL